MSDTPRTDKAASLIQYAVVGEQYQVVTAEFARELERELAGARAAKIVAEDIADELRGKTANDRYHEIGFLYRPRDGEVCWHQTSDVLPFPFHTTLPVYMKGVPEAE